MNKRMRTMVMVLAGLWMSVIPAWAADYANMTTEELAALRDTMQNANQEEHAAFQSGWQNRIREMTQEERQKYLGPPANAPRDGSDMQSGQGEDSMSGRGEMGGKRGMGGMGGGRGGGR